MSVATVMQVTRNLWHVFDGERKIGAVLRVNGERETVYQAQADGRAADRWETCATFDDAQTVLLAIAGGCVAPDVCSCSYCAQDIAPMLPPAAPHAMHDVHATADATTPPDAPALSAAEETAARFSRLEID